jgi:nucleotide-binding universal stress UspA family protein
MEDIDSRGNRHLGTAAGHKTAVRQRRSALEDDGHDPSIHGGVSEAGGQIVEVAARRDGDFVVVGGKRRSPLGNAVSGRTAQEVLPDATCPVVYTGARVEA